LPLAEQIGVADRAVTAGTVAGSLPQLANVLTIQDLQNWPHRTGINLSPVKKTDLPFGLPLTIEKLTKMLNGRMPVAGESVRACLNPDAEVELKN
jgi:hypothetical protein